MEQSPTLNTKKLEKRGTYKSAKARQRKTWDLSQVKCIKDENQKDVDEEAGKGFVFPKLFNECGKINTSSGHHDNSKHDRNYKFCGHICSNRTKQSMKKMKNGKIVGPAIY